MNATVDEVIAIAAEEKASRPTSSAAASSRSRTPAPSSPASRTSLRMRDRLAARHRTPADRARETAERIRRRRRRRRPPGPRRRPRAAREARARPRRRRRALGVTIHEQTRSPTIEPGTAVTPYGTVRAPYVLRCTEGFTAGLAGQRRALAADELRHDRHRAAHPRPVWDTIGWGGRETARRHGPRLLYAQRTADDRIALGGRGIPYRYGSRTDIDGRTQAGTVEAAARDVLAASSRQPPAPARPGLVRRARRPPRLVRHRRPRPLAPASAGPAATSAAASTTTNLAGRTLRDLVLDRDTELRRLAWHGSRMRRWEPEPLRWVGVRAMYGLYRAADRARRRLRRTSRIAWSPADDRRTVTRGAPAHVPLLDT